LSISRILAQRTRFTAPRNKNCEQMGLCIRLPLGSSRCSLRPPSHLGTQTSHHAYTASISFKVMSRLNIFHKSEPMSTISNYGG